jgi:iron complex outermembrane recepter protein
MNSILSAVVAATLALSALQATGDEAPGERRVALVIKSKTLAEALDQWAQQTGFQILVPNWEMARNLAAPSLKGTFSARVALDRLLSGTPLMAEWLNERAVTIRERTVSTGSGPTLRPATEERTVHALQFASAESPHDRTETVGGPINREQGSEPPGHLQSIDEVVVTGTHIRGGNTSQVTVYTKSDIERSGYSTTQEFVQSLPLNFKGGALGASEDGIVGSGFAAQTNVSSASTINLRGLGEGSTLVLINGRRVAPSAYGSAVDISLIPMGAIERIEILADGSSAIYGSDAVAGVVNFILRKDYEGLETTARYGSGSRGGPDEQEVAQTVGLAWEGGSSLINLQYRDRDRLPSSERSFTRDIPQPTDLLPDTRQYGASWNLQQSVARSVSVFLDALYADQHSERNFSDDFSQTLTTANTKSSTISAGTNIQVLNDWQVGLSISRSQEETDLKLNGSPPPFGYVNGAPYLDNDFVLNAADLQLDGPIVDVSGGTIRAALGASYREEEFTSTIPWQSSRREVTRNVRAAYGEVLIPLISSANEVRMVRRLSLSAAYRYDEYSDFGSTDNPRVGIEFSPIDALDLRASYSRSFRAPNANELGFVDVGRFVALTDFGAAEGGTVPTLLLVGSEPELSPEKSTNFSVSMEYRPSSALRTILSYYHIRFRNRIIFPPVDFSALLQPEVYGSLITAFVDDAAAQRFLDGEVANGAVFFGGDVSGVRYAYSIRQQNAAVVRQSGLDAAVEYSVERDGTQYAARLSSSYIDKIDTAFTDTSVPENLVDRYGGPLRLRARVDASIQRGMWQLNFAVNHHKGYTDTTPVPHTDIGAWTTADMSVRLMPGSGFAIALSAINVFDRDPPRVEGGGISRAHYDPANADPRGRFVSFQVRKSW